MCSRRGRFDPDGIHGAIWGIHDVAQAESLPGKDRATVAYDATDGIEAYVNPFAVGEKIPDLPLFLRRNFYVWLPLEETYTRAFSLLEKPLRERVESGK